MTVADQMARFADRHGKQLIVQAVPWRYYRLGAGPAVLWLTGGLRRAAVASAFLEILAAHHTVIAPDYPPVLTVGDFLAAFDGRSGRPVRRKLCAGGPVLWRDAGTGVPGASTRGC